MPKPTPVAPPPRKAGSLREFGRLAGEGAGGDQQGETGRDDGADDDDAQACLVLAHGLITLVHAGGADGQDLGGGDAFGVGQVGVDDQGAAQRDREGDPQDAAEHTDGHRFPERKVHPPADHDEAGQDEDDGAHGPADRGHGLDGHILPDGRALEGSQDRHGDDRRRDGGSEGQADLQAQIGVGGGEDHRQQTAQDQGADGQFDTLHARNRGSVCHWVPLERRR
jgi:hypothetical protein